MNTTVTRSEQTSALQALSANNGIMSIFYRYMLGKSATTTTHRDADYGTVYREGRQCAAAVGAGGSCACS